jgi:hypothetical protein
MFFKSTWIKKFKLSSCVGIAFQLSLLKPVIEGEFEFFLPSSLNLYGIMIIVVIYFASNILIYLLKYYKIKG